MGRLDCILTFLIFNWKCVFLTVTTSSTKLQPNTTMSEQCVIAVAICQVKCRSGFMTDNNDCTFCTCKSEIAKTCKYTLIMWLLFTWIDWLVLNANFSSNSTISWLVFFFYLFSKKGNGKNKYYIRHSNRPTCHGSDQYLQLIPHLPTNHFVYPLKKIIQ